MNDDRDLSHPSYDNTMWDAVRCCWELHLTCRGCGKKAIWRHDKLTTMPENLTFRSLAKGARCDCGHVGADLHYYNDHAARRRKDLAEKMKERGE